jgi:histidinol-phosphatase (PHP family)
MRLSSLHTHSTFCDGSDDVQTLCARAYEKGLCAIGFSSHGPISPKTGIKTNWHLDEGRLEQYLGEVRAAQSRWKGKLQVFLGLELDYIKGLRCALDRDIRSLGLDFLIGSVHYLVPANGAQPFTIDGPLEELERGVGEGFGGDGEAMMNTYWDAVAEMVSLGGFDILGHIDLVRKNNPGGRFFNTESEAWQQRIREVADLVCKGGCVVEITTGGLNRGKRNDTYPSLPLLRLLSERGVPALISADAHKAADLDGHYDFALQALARAGYSEHTLFEGRDGGKAQWSRELIRVEA